MCIFIVVNRCNSNRPPALPPTSLDDPPPRPPERPPKKPALRSQFPSQKDLPASSNFSNEDASKLGRPYYYRRPPAPDPPLDGAPTSLCLPQTSSALDTSSLLSDSTMNGEPNASLTQAPLSRFPRRSFSHSLNLTPCHASLPNFSQGSPAPPLSPTIQTLASQTSRSSTPELPPPPPLQAIEQEENVTIVDDEPLPPPPSDIARSNSKISSLRMAFESNAFDVPSSQGGASNTSESSLHSLSNANHVSSPPPPPKTPPPPLCDTQEQPEFESDSRWVHISDHFFSRLNFSINCTILCHSFIVQVTLLLSLC